MGMGHGAGTVSLNWEVIGMEGKGRTWPDKGKLYMGKDSQAT